MVLTNAEIDHIVNGFKSKTLPKPEWTHTAHVVVAAWFILEHGVENATPLICEGIKTYNVSVGGHNTDTDGYHETITLFWIKKIDAKLKGINSTFSIHQKINQVLDEDFVKSNYPLKFYSEGLLMSVYARKNWVEGDLG